VPQQSGVAAGRCSSRQAMRPLRIAAFVCAWAVLWGLTGCAGSSAPEGGGSSKTNESLESCSVMDASACLQPQPSFARDITPLLNRDCNTCHTPGSTLWPLVGYENVRDWAYLILSAVQQCTMPPADGGGAPLSTEDRALLVDWIACGANNN